MPTVSASWRHGTIANASRPGQRAGPASGVRRAHVTTNDGIGSQTSDRMRVVRPPRSIAQARRLVLTDAICLHAAWLHPFDKKETTAGFAPLPGPSIVAPGCSRVRASPQSGVAECRPSGCSVTEPACAHPRFPDAGRPVAAWGRPSRNPRRPRALCPRRSLPERSHRR